MAHRIERVNEMLLRELTKLILEATTGELPMIAIDRVVTTPDLKSAKVYVSTVGNHQHSNLVIQFLESKRPEFQQAIARAGNLKFTPVLNFQISQFHENVELVNRLIERIHKS